MSATTAGADGGEGAGATATLLRLLNTFPSSIAGGLPAGSDRISSLAELSDGRALFHFLHALEPAHFDLEPLQQSSGGSGGLDASSRESNLQYLIDSLETFFEESMGKNMDLGFLQPSVMAAAPSGNGSSEAQLLSLLELVLLCAINSAGKEDVIGAIMAMSDEEQQELMMLIHNMMAKADKSGGGAGAAMNISASAAPATPSSPGGIAGSQRTPLRKRSSDFMLGSPSSLVSSPAGDTPSAAASAASAAALAQAQAAAAAAAKQVASLEAEKAALTKQLDASTRAERQWKLQAHEAAEQLALATERARTELAAAVAQREGEVERASNAATKNELARLSKEIARGEARVAELEQNLSRAHDHSLALQRDLLAARESQEESQGELSRLRDELHLAQSKAEELSSLKTKHEKLRTRLEEMEALRAQNQALESESSRQLDRIIALEASTREVDALRTQLNRLKDLNVANDGLLLDRTLAEEAARAQVAELKEQLQLQRDEQRNIESELKAARSERDEARSMLRSSNRAGASSAIAGGPLGGGDLTDDSGDAAATIRRLEAEVARLRSDAAAGGSKSPSADGSSGEGGSSIEVSLLRSQKEALQEKYLEAQRKLAAQNSEMEKARRAATDAAERAERTLDEERERARELEERANAAEQKAAAAAAAPPAAVSEELSLLRAEVSELHEKLEVAQAAAIAAMSPTSAAAAAAAAAASPASPPMSPTKSRATAAAAEAAAASAAAAAAAQTELDAVKVRCRKLEAYARAQQKKVADVQREHESTQAQLAAEHTAYKEALELLRQRERELVDREKARMTEQACATRERKLLSSAFYSIGMDYQMALLNGRAVSKTAAHAPSGRSWLSQQRASAANQ